MADESAKIDVNKNPGLMAVTNDDGDLKPLRADGNTEVLIILDYPHAEIHAGSTFHVCHVNESVGDDDVIEIVLETGPTKEPHCIFSGQAGGDALFEVFEGTSGISGGTSATIRNKNRIVGDGGNAMSGTINPASLDYDGEKIDQLLIPGGTRGNSTGGGGAQRDEWPLAPNETYLFRLTNIAGSAKPASVQVEWYEHTKRT